MLLEGEAGTLPLDRSSSAMQNLYKNALFAKKQAKVQKYEITKGGKKYKKYLISKKFKEDSDGKAKRISKQEKADLTAKL